jgi:hypothetical protein
MGKREEQVHRTEDDTAVMFDSVRVDTEREAITDVLDSAFDDDWSEAEVIHREENIHVVRLEKEQEWEPNI